MPTTNPFFSSTTGYTGEQSLVDSLVIEQISMFGVDLMYMPRENINLDRLLHESTKNVFKMALSIPMYIKSFDGYDNSIEILSKFGVRSSDELTLVMSRSQWSTYYAPYVKSMYNAQSGRDPLAQNDPLEGQTARRPKEGDLIFFPFDDGIFEVKYVQFDQPFFQLGKGYIYELQCEKFEYSGEDFQTGIPQIDEVAGRSAFPNLEFIFNTGGTGTYTFQEEVEIYDVSGVDYTTPEEFFQLHDDAGLINRVPVVKAKVATWNIVERKLTLTDVTDMDPTQMNRETGDVNISKFATSLVIGKKSGAKWVSVSSDQQQKPFDDAKDIQEEFNRIKVYDPIDDNPFGFV